MRPEMSTGLRPSQLVCSVFLNTVHKPRLDVMHPISDPQSQDLNGIIGEESLFPLTIPTIGITSVRDTIGPDIQKYPENVINGERLRWMDGWMDGWIDR